MLMIASYAILTYCISVNCSPICTGANCDALNEQYETLKDCKDVIAAIDPKEGYGAECVKTDE